MNSLAPMKICPVCVGGGGGQGNLNLMRAFVG